MNNDSNSNSKLNTLQNLKDQIYFIGTMHIAIESATFVKEIIELLKLDCVMIELDEIRYQEILHPTKQQNNLKNSRETEENLFPDSLFNTLQQIQQEIGKLLGMIPGMEMISAINAVRQHKIPIKLIDQPIIKTFQRLNELQESAKQEQNEFLKILKENPISGEDSNIYELIDEFKKPEFIKQMIQDFKTNYPNLSRVLITERNEYMVNQIVEYFKDNPTHRILIVIGVGHLDEIMRLTNEKISK